MMASRNNDTVTIPIHIRNVHDLNNDPQKKGIRAGSFEGPDPLVNVTPGTKIQWQITPPTHAFTITFQNVSPVPGVMSISNTPPNGISNPVTVSILGHYHYSVTVSDGTTTWVISSCPELDVGGVS